MKNMVSFDITDSKDPQAREKIAEKTWKGVGVDEYEA